MKPPSKLTEILGDVHGASLTADKTDLVMQRGYKISGFILCHPETGERCIVEMSAVRWLSRNESWWLMHASKSPINEK